ncbi:hypothetical protein HYH02_005566 [Chlamydomonas schloesseri]|uniref:SRCR domain-containing protein n=1 Tax=Chlamydomonas schloesseri TaxID=2026947 RepID=A0A835WL63_9CHLO|nr:hypothetical protein HYH02_005566 [Chlamydomonas schloesseri]|eukprot:KAG2449417.1 hypothetical protein HYH02_005566 [Chlamydomonas schloesseri]
MKRAFLLLSLLSAAALLLLSVAEGRPRAALQPPIRSTSLHRLPPPRRASPPPTKSRTSPPASIPKSPSHSTRPGAKPSQRAPPSSLPYEGNGVRVVGDQGGRGRLEIAAVEYDGTVNWRPVCASGEFDNKVAQVMCEMMGYIYGRTYYTAEVAFNTSLSASQQTVDSIQYCLPNTPMPPASVYSDAPPVSEDQSGGGHRHYRRRRTLMYAGGSLTAAGAGAQQQQQQQQSRQLRRVGGARGLAAVRLYNIDAPLDAPYFCAFTVGSCRSAAFGPLAGVECALFEFPPAPPPPPAPPRTPLTPPAPPPLSSTIRMFGGSPRGAKPAVEPNLCSGTLPNWPGCSTYGRVELLLVSNGNGNLIWAPLCLPSPDGSISSTQLASQLAVKACKQVLNWSKNVKPVFYVNGYPLSPGFAIPSSPVTSPYDFDPAKYPGWVSVVGGNLTSATTLQDLDLVVLDQPCPSGYMFGVQCSIAMP